MSATIGGLLACVVWCTSVAVTRRVTEDLGALCGGMLATGLAGSLGLLRLILRSRRSSAARSMALQSRAVVPAVPSDSARLWTAMLRRIPAAAATAGLSWSYLLGCGVCFVAYQFCLLLAIGLAVDDAQVVVVGVLNYLWPALTLALSVPLLGRRWTAWLFLGLALAIVGEILVVGCSLLGEERSAAFLDPRGLWSYSLATLAACCWGLYSNLARRLAGTASGDAVPLFLMATSLTLLPLVLVFTEQVHWTALTGGALAFMAVFPGLLGYTWWDRGMRFGHARLLTVASYLIPLGSTGATCLMLWVWPGWPVWLGAALVIGGAIVCQHSIADREPPGS